MTNESNPSPYRAIGTSISYGKKTLYTTTLASAQRGLEFLSSHGCDGLRIEKWTEGIGYELHEEEMEKSDMVVTVELEATQLAELLAKIAELAERVEALERQVKND